MRRWCFALCLMALSADLACTRAGTLAQFRTVIGDLEVELYEQDKPVTVQNFVRYVRMNYYQNVFLHRCVPGFVVQSGGYAVANASSTNQFTQAYSVPSLGQITNEYAVGTTESNLYGTIAMAKKAGNPDSATSEWFFNL